MSEQKPSKPGYPYPPFSQQRFDVHQTFRVSCAPSWVMNFTPRIASGELPLRYRRPKPPYHPSPILVVAPTERWAKLQVPKLRLPKEAEVLPIGAFGPVLGQRFSRIILIELDKRHEEWVRDCLLGRLVAGGEVQRFYQEQVDAL